MSSSPGEYCHVLFEQAGNAIYQAATMVTEVVIECTYCTPTVTWLTPSPIAEGTALSSAQLDATSSIPGTFVYLPSAGTVLPSGTQTLSVIFTPTNSINYSTASATVPLIVGSAGQPVNAQPVITSLLMTSGTAGTPVTLMGFNFGTSGTVSFNRVPATPTSWTPNSIVVPIPAGAISGLVVVSTNGLTSNGVPIMLTSPVSCPVQ
jgi:hypothetical protein